MTSTLIWTSFIAFFVLAMVSPFLPLFLMWRSAALSALAFIAYRLLRGPVHWSDMDFGYLIGTSILMLFISAVFVALALRFGVAVYYNWLRAEILVGENTRWIDTVLLAAIGAVGGLALTIGMAIVFGGSSGGRMLDLGIGLTASAVIVLMIVYRDSGLTIPVTVLALVLATFSFVGSEQAARHPHPAGLPEHAYRALAMMALMAVLSQ